MTIYLTSDKGTMFGGKSSALWRYYRQYTKKKHLRIICIKPLKDNRYSCEHIVTHDNKRIPCVRVEHLMEIDTSEWDVIIVDEGQWFSDLYLFVSTYFRLGSFRMHVAGLNGDKNQTNFGDINAISPFCSEEYVHYGMCAVCGDKAPFTKERIIREDRDIPGGDDDYYTVCHKHLDIPGDQIDIYSE